MKDVKDFAVLTRACAKAVREAKADGVVDWRDAPKVVQTIGPLREAVKDANKIPEQVKAASSEELQAALQDQVAATAELAEALLG